MEKSSPGLKMRQFRRLACRVAQRSYLGQPGLALGEAAYADILSVSFQN
jgi:hypothetical protein